MFSDQRISIIYEQIIMFVYCRRVTLNHCFIHSFSMKQYYSLLLSAYSFLFATVSMSLLPDSLHKSLSLGLYKEVICTVALMLRTKTLKLRFIFIDNDHLCEYFQVSNVQFRSSRFIH